MPFQKPTVVILGAGWHTPKSYHKLTTALESVHYSVHVPPYLSMNQSRPPYGNLVTDTFSIRSYIESLLDRNLQVIVFMHSYGGSVGTNALSGLSLDARKKEGKPGGILHLIFQTCYAVTEFGTMVSYVQRMGDLHLMPFAFDYDWDNTCLHRAPELMLAGGTYTDAEKESFLASLKRWNGACMFEPVQRCAWREIPSTFVHTLEDQTFPLRYQRVVVEDMKKELSEKQVGWDLNVEQLETGHGAMVTATEELVGIIEKVASAKVAWSGKSGEKGVAIEGVKDDD